MHATYLRDLGCNKILYFIDRPGNFVPSAFTSTHKDVLFLMCDEEYWAKRGGRPGAVPLRQMVNLSSAKTMLDDDYIFHIYSDEFPIIYRSVSDILNAVPGGTSSVRMQNVERVLIKDANRWTEGILRKPALNSALVRRAYGSRSVFLGNGLASYFHGKSFTRNHKDVMASVHGEYINGRETSRTMIPLNQAMLVHFDCISLIHWKSKIARRMRDVKSGLKMFPHERRLLDYVLKSPNPDVTLNKLANLMHRATPEEATRWISAGVAEEMPDWFLARLEKAAGGPQMLDAAFADRSMAAFYNVQTAVG